MLPFLQTRRVFDSSKPFCIESILEYGVRSSEGQLLLVSTIAIQVSRDLERRLHHLYHYFPSLRLTSLLYRNWIRCYAIRWIACIVARGSVKRHLKKVVDQLSELNSLRKNRNLEGQLLGALSRLPRGTGQWALMNSAVKEIISTLSGESSEAYLCHGRELRVQTGASSDNVENSMEIRINSFDSIAGWVQKTRACSC